MINLFMSGHLFCDFNLPSLVIFNLIKVHPFTNEFIKLVIVDLVDSLLNLILLFS